MSDRCGRPITVTVMAGMATILRQQCALPAGHFGPCLTPGQVIG